MKNNSKILIIAPHQDDEVIGCGGTIALLDDRGYSVSVVHVFRGSSGVENKSERESSLLRHKEAHEASRFLGFKLLDNLGFEDRHESRISKIQDALISVIRKLNPAIVFAPHSNEQDSEHRLVSKASWEASWLAATKNFSGLGNKVSRVEAVLGYEVWTPIKQPDFYLDITDFISIKREALRRYKSQIKNTSWLEGACGLNSYRGTTLQGNGFAEAFEMRASNLTEFVSFFKKLAKR